jgi:hypothetical protein
VKTTKFPAPKRAGLERSAPPTREALRRKLAQIRRRDPEAFEALRVLISRMVDD